MKTIIALAAFLFVVPVYAQTASPKTPSTIAEYKVALAERDLALAKAQKAAYINSLSPAIEAMPQVVQFTKAVEAAQAALDAAKSEEAKGNKPADLPKKK